jgi:predicted transcriptional regulator
MEDAVSAEPDTRPFTRAELARFLEDLEVGRRVPRTSVIEARAPRVVGSESATTLGMGKLLPMSPPPLSPRARTSRAAQAGRAEAREAELRDPSPLERLPTHAAAARPKHSPTGAAQATSCLRSFPDPFSGSVPTARWRRVRLRALLVLGPFLMAALIASLVRLPAASRQAAVTRVGPPPLPTASQPLPSAAVDHDRSAPRTQQQLTLKIETVESETVESEPVESKTGESEPGEAVPSGRPELRREAVDLLIAGRTRAALAAYRTLPRAWLAEAALAQAVRLLERELRECNEQAGISCGT